MLFGKMNERIAIFSNGKKYFFSYDHNKKMYQKRSLNNEEAWTIDGEHDYPWKGIDAKLSKSVKIVVYGQVRIAEIFDLKILPAFKVFYGNYDADAEGKFIEPEEVLPNPEGEKFKTFIVRYKNFYS